jgi:hypothetical protein
MNDTEAYLRNSRGTLHTKLSGAKSLKEETQLVNDIADCHAELASFLFRRSKMNKINVKRRACNNFEKLLVTCALIGSSPYQSERKI